MYKDFLPFALPDIGTDEIDEVVKCLKSGWITTGHISRQFEIDFAAFVGGDVEAIAVNSATAGLHLALEAIGVGHGDEVLVPDFTFTASAEVVRYLGAEPIFVDIDPVTYNMDPEDLRQRVTGKTKAIIPVHFAGLSCDMRSIRAIAKEHNLRIVEDAAHALPATYDREIIGAGESDAVVFSFYATKTITTGEGGMIVTKSPDVASRCKVMRLHGISRDAFDRYTSPKPSWHYEVIAPGFKYNLTDVASAIGIHQLKKANKFQKRRQEIADAYNAAFADLPVILPPKARPGDQHSWHLYVLRIQGETLRRGRSTIIEELSEQGIGTSVHFIPLHLHPYWRDRYGWKEHDFPNTMDIYRSCFSLPIYTRMRDEDVERVIQEVRGVVSK